MRHIWLLLLLLTISAELKSQPAPQPTAASTQPGQITLGQSIVPLYGPWKFHIGDSPLDPATHQPLWAQPGFDDSHWETVDLTTNAGAIDPDTGAASYVPGWTAKGHPGVSGYGWYRLRVRVTARAGQRLAIAEDAVVDDAYQVFSDGSLIGAFGDFAKADGDPIGYFSRPEMFPVPPQSIQASSGVATNVLAFRLYMAPHTIEIVPDAGGLHAAPTLGEAAVIAARYQIGWLNLIRRYAMDALLGVFFLLLAVLTAPLVFFDRSDPVYLWMAAIFLLIALNSIGVCLQVWTTLQSIHSGDLLTGLLFSPVRTGLLLMIWWVWFRLERPAWVPRAILMLVVLYALADPLGTDLFALVPHPVGVWFHTASAALRLASLVLLMVIVALGIRKQGREGWLVVPSVLLLAVSLFQRELRVLNIRVMWFPFGTQLTISNIALVAFAATIFALLIRRLLLSLRRQREQALDVKQAQQVQHVLLPEASATHPGFTIASDYRPAREVGGDFFQILSVPADSPTHPGSLLIVAGDVTGKGLQAGMLVALLVGATRSTAELNPDPLFVLEALNRRLLGRSNAQATGLALLVAPNGEATLANAGHIPPYLNGEPLAMEGALPLGMIEGAEFPIMHFHIAPNDKLLILSDGILEATARTGELFGFERVQQFLRDTPSIHSLADAAQTFGQEDDISLISIVRA